MQAPRPEEREEPDDDRREQPQVEDEQSRHVSRNAYPHVVGEGPTDVADAAGDVLLVACEVVGRHQHQPRAGHDGDDDGQATRDEAAAEEERRERGDRRERRELVARDGKRRDDQRHHHEHGLQPDFGRVREVWIIRSSEPSQHQGDHHQVQEERQGLGGEVVLADPVGEVERQDRDPDDPAVLGGRAHDHEQRGQVQQVEEHRRPGREGLDARKARDPGEEREEREEPRPVEVCVDRRVDLAGAVDDIGDADMPPRHLEGRDLIDHPADAVQHHDERDRMEQQDGGVVRHPPDAEREAREQESEGDDDGGGQRGDEPEVAALARINAL